MKDFNKIFLDTAPLIYFLDNNPHFGEKSRRIIDSFLNENKILVSSVLTCEEYLIMPYRNQEHQLIDEFWRFIKDSNMILYPINRQEAVKAAKIRAEYKFFKPMDSLQLATAVLHGCNLFLTNDKQLKQFPEINDEWQF